VSKFTIGVSPGLKRELDWVGDELKEKLILPNVSYDRIIRELLIEYRGTYPRQPRRKRPVNPDSKPRGRPPGMAPLRYES
jgi:hypothetical protein